MWLTPPPHPPLASYKFIILYTTIFDYLFHQYTYVYKKKGIEWYKERRNFLFSWIYIYIYYVYERRNSVSWRRDRWRRKLDRRVGIRAGWKQRARRPSRQLVFESHVVLSQTHFSQVRYASCWSSFGSRLSSPVQLSWDTMARFNNDATLENWNLQGYVTKDKYTE